MTNHEPPPKVTNLKANKAGPLCPGKTVKFKASTSPISAIVTWTLAIGGGEPEPVEGDGNTLEISGGSGERITVTASLSNIVSKTARWKVADLQINVPPGPDNGRYVITDEPRMPVITATALFQGGSGTVSEWEVLAAFRADDCPPDGPDNLKTMYRASAAGGNEVTAHFPENVVRGGIISFSAKGRVNGCAVSAAGAAGLAGTNPQQTDIQNFPGMHKTLQRIACKESGQRQFNAAANGGTGYCPLFGPGGKVGIMQIANPTDDQIWNWKENVTAGINKFNESKAAAEDYPNEVMQSEGFKSLVEQFNEKRQQQGLGPILVDVLPFTKGNFDAEDISDLQQRELDAVRGYDDSTDEDSTDHDQFGLKLHEYRVVVDLIGGEQVLRVINIDEETLRGEAVWERVPPADRHFGRANYVEEVLAFAFDCSPRTVPLVVDIRAEDGTSDPCRILAPGRPRKYSALVAPAGGTLKWTCSGGASIFGSASAQLVTVRGDVVSTTVDDAVLTLEYKRGGRSRTKRIKLTVADVTKIAVRVKASAALTPGRGTALADHEFECTETAEAFPAHKSLILLRGDFEDVELQATVKPDGTPLFWDVMRAFDDAPALGTGIPKLHREPGDATRAKLHTNETGSFFVRVCGDCGNKKFDEKGPLKLLPTVMVQATLETDASMTNPDIARQTETTVDTHTNVFHVIAGTALDLDHPSKATIYMQAFVKVVSGGNRGRRLIEQVFAGWVNNERADKTSGSYTAGHSVQTVYATNAGTGRNGIFKPGDQPQLVAPPVSDAAPLLDSLIAGRGGETATVVPSRIRDPRTDLDPGQQWIVEAVVNTGCDYPLLHPVSTAASPVRLQGLHFERHFTANLCLWTNRSGHFGDVADRSYGVLRSFEWDLNGAWSINAANKPAVITPMSASISRRRTKDPLATPKDAFCEVCDPIVLDVHRLDGRT